MRRTDGEMGWAGVRVVALAILVLALVGTPHGVVALQDAEVECETLDPGPAPRAAALDETSPDAASPEASPETASPVAEDADAATPEGGDDLAGGTVDDATAVHVELLVETVAACQSSGDAETLVDLVTERFLGDVYAGGAEISRAAFAQLAEGLPRTRVDVRSVEPRIDPDGEVSAEVESTVGRQLVRARWTFRFEPEPGGDRSSDETGRGRWQVDAVAFLPVEAPEDAVRVELRLDEYEFQPDEIRVDGPDIVIEGENRGDATHEILVLRLDDVETSDLLQPGPALPVGVAVIGQVTIPAGEAAQLVLVNVRRGEYAIVDLLPNREGTPHLALGMEATLTVE